MTDPDAFGISRGRLPRREFFTLSAATVFVGGAASLSPATDTGSGAAIRIGLIGCGGRGTGAALQAAAADPAVRIVALGDAFPDQVDSSAHVLARDAGPQFDCPPARRFSGGDAYQRVIEQAVDVVLIAAPPALRPLHVEAAVVAGKHVFCETPAAVDIEGVHRVAHAFAAARACGLSIASGLHTRRDGGMTEFVRQLHGGVLGVPARVEVHAAHGLSWRVPARPDWTVAEATVRNWISSDSLSGGRFVERHVHALDRALWVLGDRAPDVVEPLPGANPGAVSVRYRFEDGAEILASTTPGMGYAVGHREAAFGSHGSRPLPRPADGRRFQVTMDVLLQSIRSARPMDDTGILVRASRAAIMGRMAMATGRPVSWQEVAGADAPAFPVRQIGADVNLVGNGRRYKA